MRLDILPSTHRDVIDAHINLAETLLRSDKLDDALRFAQRAVAIVDETGNQQHPRRHNARLTLYRVEAAKGIPSAGQHLVELIDEMDVTSNARLIDEAREVLEGLRPY